MLTSRRNFIAGTVATTAVPMVLADKKDGLDRAEMPRPDLRADDLDFLNGRPFNGKVLADGKPLAGVVVTNGRDCVKTGKDGCYHLPEYSGARFVAMTVPSGYAAEWWYHDAWRRRLGFDFRLTACSETAANHPCRFIHVADSEITTADGQDWIANLRALADSEKPAFIVHTGDIWDREGMMVLNRAMNAQTMGRKVVFVIGNHDLVSTYPWGEAQFESIFGPAWHSFDACGVHFVVTPMAYGDRPSSYTDDMIADWLRQDLSLVSPGTPVVVFNHYTCNPNDPNRRAVVYGDGRPLDLRKVCNLRAWVYGHTHTSWFYRRDGVAVINTSNPNMGGIDNSPNCVRVIDVPKDGPVVSDSRFGDYRPMTRKRAGAVWETKLPAGVTYGGVRIVGDVLLMATSDDDGRGTGYVCAVDRRTGKVLWRAQTENTIKGSLAVSADSVIGTDVEGRVSAFDLKNGACRWMTNVGKGVRGPVGMLATGTRLSPTGDEVVVGVGSRQAVLNVATGNVKWLYAHYFERETVPLTPAWTADRIITPVNWGGLYCNDAKTGKILWSVPGFSFPGASPYVSGDVVVFVSEGRVRKFDVASGKLLQERLVVPNRGFAVPGDLLETEDLYLKGSSADGLVALDKKTLEIRWRGMCGTSLAAFGDFQLPGLKCVPTTPVRLTYGRICAAAADGGIYCWSESDGKVLKRFETGALYLGGVATDGHFVYAADAAGVLRALRI